MANDFPKMLYSDDGRTHVQRSENDELPEGNWQDEPTDAFLGQPASQHFATVNPPSSDPHASLIDRIIERLRSEFPSLSRNPPGRPPGSVNRNSSNDGDSDNG